MALFEPTRWVVRAGGTTALVEYYNDTMLPARLVYIFNDLTYFYYLSILLVGQFI